MLQSQIFDNHLVFTIGIYPGGCSILLHTWTMGFGFAIFPSPIVLTLLNLYLVACRKLRTVDRQYVFLHPSEWQR